MLLLALAVDGGSVTPFEGRLEKGASYELTGENDPERGIDLIAQTFQPPILKLPHHHAGRVEWLGEVALPHGRVRVVFKVESLEVQRMTERRWNSTWKCRVISAEVVTRR